MSRQMEFDMIFNTVYIGLLLNDGRPGKFIDDRF